MPVYWLEENCPACKATNWLNLGDINDGDSSKMDVMFFDCWKCKAEIVLGDGDCQTDYKPHVVGTGEWDNEADGMHVDGKEKPYA